MSDVWEFFEKVRNDDNITISFECQLCEATYGISTSTTTLRRHLLNIHNSVYISNNSQPKQITPYTLAKQSHITTKLAEWITVDLQPFSTIEQAEFKQFIYTLDPRYVLPCRQTIKQEVNSLFSERRTNIQSELNGFTTKVALTTDIWTSNYNHTAFLGITLHYIDGDWQLKKCLLDFIPIEGPHSARSILNKLINLLQEFNISDRVISITTDNGSNILACGRDLACKLKACFFNLTFSHKRCAAHIINIAVKAGMKHIDTSIIKLRKFVIKIRNSQILLNDLKSICRIKNQKFLMPIQDVETRWNATFQMIERQITMKNVVEILVNAHDDILKNLYPTNSAAEWIKILVYNLF
jgi:hypothetical protein